MNKAALRKEAFPVTDHCVYFNHAAVGPLSTAAYRAMEEHAREQRDCGARHWRAEHAHFRKTAARLLGADRDEISILKNTSEGLSFVAEGLGWRAGENVITSDSEFPSNYVPWKRLERRGVECRLIRSVDGAFTPEDVAALIDGKTRVVSLSSVAFHNGFAPDLVRIGQICADAGVLFCVDAIQSLGALPLDVREARISFLAADGHKWLLAPEGTAIFFVAAGAREELEVFETGWMNIELGGRFIGCGTELFPDGRRYEAGSLNTNGVYGLNASMDLLLEIGIDRIAPELLRIAERLATSLEGIGFTIHTPRPIGSGIIAATPPEFDLSALRERLREGGDELPRDVTAISALHRWLEHENVICAPREGMLRLSPHFYNDEREIDEVVAILREVV
jgi:cysteine desulfurase / selenocysteine lyase